MTKISTLSDQPFSFSQWNRIFGVKNHNFFEQGQNIGIFASATKGMDTFLFEKSMKLMFTFKNFRNVYWHGTQHSAMVSQEKIFGPKKEKVFGQMGNQMENNNNEKIDFWRKKHFQWGIGKVLWRKQFNRDILYIMMMSMAAIIGGWTLRALLCHN